VHEYVVPLPVFKDAKDKTTIAAESEIVALSDKTFLMLARDSGNGQGLKGDTSLYRKVDIVDVSAATDIAGSDFDDGKPIAPKGVVDPSLTPARLTPFIDLNDKADLARFGLHNGAPNDKNNLSEKWEAMGLASVLDPNLPDDYFLFVGTREPRKDLGTLLAAYAALRADRTRVAEPPTLLLVGPAGWGPDQQPSPGVEVHGYASAADLRVIVAGARTLVMPSRDEGFGLPALEGLAAGSDVIVSAVPAMVEVTGGLATVFPIGDVEALTAALADRADPPDREAADDLRRHGPTPTAFTIKTTFLPADATPRQGRDEWFCPA